MSTPFPQPVEIRRDGRTEIVITWADGHLQRMTNHYMRCKCQCAACVDEWTRKPLLDPAQIPADIHADQIAVVGSYGIQPFWSDGHTTGIFSFPLLRGICPCDACKAAA
ncbi:MAG: DUF971 domain-containing protein [Nitrospirae bacterium]|nr:DUF971 domain-containing protein [Nitrospirota bacterium]